MANETFEQNLLRMIAATLHFHTTLTAAREMFGRSYFSLGIAERAIVDQTVVSNSAGNFQVITPEFLASQKAQEPVGFRGPGAT
jgi:hypothetical protein